MSTARVVIRDATVSQKKVGDFRMEIQRGLFVKSESEAAEIEIRVPDGGQPHPPGEYTLDGKSFHVDEYGRVTVCKRGIVLVPVVRAAAAGAVK